VQQLNFIEEELCNEWTWRTKHKKKKNRQCKSCLQEGSEADRAMKCSRTVMSLVCHC
jgi:hypothetical protein